MSEKLRSLESTAKESAIESLQKMLDKIGVPMDMKWRSAIMFMRSIREYSICSDDQKHRIQEFVIKMLKDKRFTDEDFNSVERNMFDIMTESSKLALNEELREISGLIRSTKAMFLQQKGEMQALETSTIDLLQGEGSIDQAVKYIRDGFQEMIALMEENTTKLIEQSLTDPLTGLGNRRALEVFLADLDDKEPRESQALSVLMLDVDHFKVINDTYGHPVGDQALNALGLVLSRLCRQFSGPNPMVAAFRYGGEEFVLVVLGLDPGRAQELAEEIRSIIANRIFEIREEKGNVVSSGVRITVSVGVASRHATLEKAGGGKLLTIADECLYAAKMGGRNQVVCALPPF